MLLFLIANGLQGVFFDIQNIINSRNIVSRSVNIIENQNIISTGMMHDIKYNETFIQIKTAQYDIEVQYF